MLNESRKSDIFSVLDSDHRSFLEPYKPYASDSQNDYEKKKMLHCNKEDLGKYLSSTQNCMDSDHSNFLEPYEPYSNNNVFSDHEKGTFCYKKYLKFNCQTPQNYSEHSNFLQPYECYSSNDLCSDQGKGRFFLRPHKKNLENDFKSTKNYLKSDQEPYEALSNSDQEKSHSHKKHLETYFKSLQNSLDSIHCNCLEPYEPHSNYNRYSTDQEKETFFKKCCQMRPEPYEHYEIHSNSEFCRDHRKERNLTRLEKYFKSDLKVPHNCFDSVHSNFLEPYEAYSNYHYCGYQKKGKFFKKHLKNQIKTSQNDLDSDDRYFVKPYEPFESYSNRDLYNDHGKFLSHSYKKHLEPDFKSSHSCLKSDLESHSLSEPCSDQKNGRFFSGHDHLKSKTNNVYCRKNMKYSDFYGCFKDTENSKLINQQKAVRTILYFLKSIRNKKIFEQLKKTINNLRTKNPKHVLKLINFVHAEIYEKFTWKVIFCLAGEEFPPKIVYRLVCIWPYVNLNKTEEFFRKEWHTFCIYRCLACKTTTKSLTETAKSKRLYRKNKNKKQFPLWFKQIY